MNPVAAAQLGAIAFDVGEKDPRFPLINDVCGRLRRALSNTAKLHTRDCSAQKDAQMDFAEFQNGPARSIFAGLGREWAAILEQAGSFEHLRHMIVSHNDRDIGRFVKAVRRYAKTCSSGEYRLLLAICAFADFGHVADELVAGRAWQDITRGCDLSFRAAIAACVEAAP